MTSLHLLAVVALISLQGCVSLQWTSTRQSQIQSCVGDTITFPWTFTPDPGDEVTDIKWLYTPGGNIPDVMATYVHGHFTPTLSFAQRLRHVESGSLEMNHVSMEDSGNYLIEVSVHRGAAYSVIRQTIILRVSGTASRGTDQLTMTLTQSEQAVYNHTTGHLHVQLECQYPSAHGEPPADVVWTTPPGSNAASSYSNNGSFYLLLRNPVKGGNYSCRLPPNSAATLCLSADAPLLRETTVRVDAVTARLTLLEAKEEALNNKLKEENRLLREELNQTRSQANHLAEELGKAKQAIEQTNDTLTSENTILMAELQRTNALLSSQNGRLSDDLRRTSDTLTNQIHGLDARLNEYHVKSSTHASFYATKGDNEILNNQDHVKFSQVYTNQGGSYDVTTGDFTIPTNGTFFFAFTSSPYHSNQYSICCLRVDGSTITYVYNKYTDYFNQATGHAVLHLVKGQRVYVVSYGDGNQFEGNLSFFSGFLVSPDW